MKQSSTKHGKGFGNEVSPHATRKYAQMFNRTLPRILKSGH